MVRPLISFFDSSPSHNLSSGSLYDLEFLVDGNGRRVAAFGKSAGQVGMAVGLQAWCRRNLVSDFETDQPLLPLTSYPSSEAMIQDTQRQLDEIQGKKPSVL